MLKRPCAAEADVGIALDYVVAPADSLRPDAAGSARGASSRPVESVPLKSGGFVGIRRWVEATWLGRVVAFLSRSGRG
jgi:hypothetical protein